MSGGTSTPKIICYIQRGTIMKSLIRYAIEKLDTGSEEEKEYGFFLQVSEEQLAALMELSKSNEVGVSCEGIVEVALPAKVPYNGVKSRLRLYSKGNGEQSCELTTKKVIDEITKTEFNDPINIVNFQALAGGGKHVNARKRITIPLKIDGETVMRESGKLLQWEIDVYLDGSNETNFKARLPNNWIKIDLEVDHPIDNVLDMLPITGERVIAANSSASDERAIIDNLYAHGYPVTPYVGLEFWDNVDDVISLATF